MATTLIIGASRGIGLELARQSLAAGERVIATARQPGDVARLEALGAQALRLNVADATSVSALGWQLDGETIDTAWHVAGVMCSRARASQPPTQAEFDRVMHANVLGAMQLIPVVAPLVAAAHGRYGFVSSSMALLGQRPGSGAWLYRVSKTALNMAVTAAQGEWPDALMLCFHPGWVQTDMGGTQAPVSVSDSAAGLRATLAAATADDRRHLLFYDGSPAATW